MEETPNKSATGSGYNTEHFKENSDNGNDADNDSGKHCDSDNKNDVNSAENLL